MIARQRARSGPIPERAVVPLAFVAAFILGVLRRPDALLNPVFFQEDRLFYEEAREGVAIWHPYAGYLHLVPRLIGGLQSRLEPTPAALLGTIVALAVMAAIAAFVASSRLRSVLPDPRLRLAVAMLVVCIPQGAEPLGAPSHLQWYLALFLVARLFADPPRTALESWGERAAVVIACLSGPLGILLAPLYWLRARPLLPWLAVSSAVQLVVLLASPRAAGGYPIPMLLDIIATRAIDQSIIGKAILLIADVRVLVAVVLLALLAVGLRSIPRSLWLSGAYLMVVPLAFGLAGNPDRTAIMLTPWAAQRYFVIIGFMLAAAVLLAAWHRRGLVQLALVALLAGGLAVSFQLAPRV